MRWVPFSISQGNPEHLHPICLCSFFLRYQSTRYVPPQSQCTIGSMPFARASRQALHLQPLRMFSGSWLMVRRPSQRRHLHGKRFMRTSSVARKIRQARLRRIVRRAGKGFLFRSSSGPQIRQFARQIERGALSRRVQRRDSPLACCAV